MPTRLDGSRKAKFQAAHPGSHAHVDALALKPRDGLRLAATIWPTLPGKDRQVLMAIDVAGVAIRLEVAPHGGAALSVGRHRVEVAAPMLARRWYGIEATVDAAGGMLSIVQKPLRPVGAIVDGGRQELKADLPAIAGTARVFIAAAPHGHAATAHYNGKI